MNLDKIIEQIRKIEKERNIQSSLIYALVELAELGEVFLQESGHSNKPPTEDGVIGEAIDVMVYMLDIIQLYSAEITGEEIETLNNPELDITEINKIRKIYGAYVDNLYEINLIACDDKIVFKSLYQLFKPFFVFYDSIHIKFKNIVDVQEYYGII